MMWIPQGVGKILLRFWSMLTYWHHIIAVDSAAEHLLSYHVPMVFYWVQIWWMVRPLNYTEPIVMFMQAFKDDLGFVPWIQRSTGYLLDVAISRCVVGRCTCLATTPRFFKQCLISIKRPVCGKKSRVSVRVSADDSSDEGTSSALQIQWLCAQSSLKFLFLADKSGTRCGLRLLEKIHLKFVLSGAFFLLTGIVASHSSSRVVNFILSFTQVPWSSLTL